MPPPNQAQIAATPNTVDFEEAIQALMSDIDAGAASTIRGPVNLATGRTVITYTFGSDDTLSANSYREPTAEEREQAKQDRSKLPDGLMLSPMTNLDTPKKEYMRSAIRKAMDEIETYANVEFQEVSHVDQVDNANLRFFSGDITGEGGHASATSNPFEPREVFLNDFEFSNAASVTPGTPGYTAVLHEITHGMGFSHPNANGRSGRAGGDDPNYTTVGSVLSYNVEGNVKGLGAYDVAALQFGYGKAQPDMQEPERKPLTVEELLPSSLLYSPSAEVDIDLRNFKGDVNYDRIDAALHHMLPANPVISGYLDNKPFSLTIAQNVQVRNLDATGSRVGITAVGNALPNKISGGLDDDWITPRGGDDTLTTGPGFDKIILDRESGVDNVVTDFDPARDSVHISGGFSNLVFRESVKQPGQTLEVYNEQGVLESAITFAGADEALLEKLAFNFIHEPKALSAIIAAGADLTKWSQEEREDALLTAIALPDAQSLDILIQEGVDLKSLRIPTNGTLLHQAQIWAPPEITQRLLESGVDPKLRDDNGNTAFHLCGPFSAADCKFVAEKMVMLIEHGADPAVKNKDGLSGFDAVRKMADNGLDFMMLMEQVRIGVQEAANEAEKNSPEHFRLLNVMAEMKKYPSMPPAMAEKPEIEVPQGLPAQPQGPAIRGK